MAKTGLEIIKALDTTAGEIAGIISKGHPPFEEGGSVACDLVTCEQCWLAWLTTGRSREALFLVYGKSHR